MDCKMAHRLIEADVDGELDLVRHLEVETHVSGCAECARVREALLARKAALRGSLPRFAAPVGLEQKIRAAILAEGSRTKASDASATQAVEPVGPVERRQTIFVHFWSVAALAASIAVALGVGYSWGDRRGRSDQLVNEAVAEHIRSLQVNHLSDVVSTDQHTVRPWFAGKLDFAPPVPDLVALGFPLAGGRLERIAGKPAAALVYRRRQHALNVFVWPAGSDPVAPRDDSQNGYHSQAWSENGFNYLAVSEISAEELNTFTTAFRAATR